MAITHFPLSISLRLAAVFPFQVAQDRTLYANKEIPAFITAKKIRASRASVEFPTQSLFQVNDGKCEITAGLVVWRMGRLKL